jgi:DNA-binding MurR/RpiR family transcriptional regulator
MLSGEVPVDRYQLMRAVMIAQAEHLTRLADAIGKDEFEQTIESIIAARTIYIVGLRLSSAAATALWHGLHLLRPNVVLANTNNGFLPDQLASCGEGDLLMGITYRRYMVDTIQSMKFARARGARVIAITDHRLSPAAVNADFVLVTPVIMQLSHIPLAPSLALISAILECVGVAYRERGTGDRPRDLARESSAFHLFTRTGDDAPSDSNPHK